MPAREAEALAIAGREATITNPDKIFFPRVGRGSGTEAGGTKLDLVAYYVAVADGVDRPIRLVALYRRWFVAVVR